MTRHLLVVGAQRCGTTYLHSVLDAHPQVTMARPARPEPKVFLSDVESAKGLDWYRARYFAHADTEVVLGEKSTSYLEHTAAARRAAVVLGHADIVVLLRDPVARAVSNWRFSTDSGLEDRPLERALLDDVERPREWDPDETSVSPYAYVRRGRYARYIEPWRMWFPDSVHVYFLEELAGSARGVAGVYADLGVDDGFAPGLLGERVNSSEGAAPALRDQVTARLRDFLAPSDQALRDLLGRGLPWDDRARPGG